MRLRNYQLAAKEAVFNAFKTSQSTLLELPTGTGKTVVFSHIANEWDGRVLVIAHRDELIRQAADKLEIITKEPIAIEKGIETARDSLEGRCRIVVGSIQTICKPNRHRRFGADFFSLIICDEGHHGTAKTYRQVFDYFASAKRLIVTATPKRADQVALSSICETVAYQYGIEAAIDDGWLVPVQQCVVKVEGLDFTKARTVAEDFNESDLEKILIEEKPLHGMCASAFELIKDRQALWFCVTVAHAKAVAGVLSRYAPMDQVAFLHGKTSDEERVATVDAYKRGNIQHLLNCGLFLEGFDAPSTSAIIMARPTKSLGLYIQILGRGTRPLPGIVDGIDSAEARRNSIKQSLKRDMLVIDFCGNAGKHKIVQALDVLSGKYQPGDLEIAKSNMEAEAGKSVAIEDALARAVQERMLWEEQQARRAKIKAVVEYSTKKVSPFVKEFTKVDDSFKPIITEVCSNKQAGYIVHLSREKGKGNWTFEAAKKLTPKQARGVIGKLQSGAA